MIVLLIICAVIATYLYFVGRRRGFDAGHLSGRGEGWMACETMIMDRAKTNEAYNHHKIWEDLLR